MPYPSNQQCIWLMFITIAIFPLMNKAMNNNYDDYISYINDKDKPMFVSVSTELPRKRLKRQRRYLYLNDNILDDNGFEQTIFMPPQSYVTFPKPSTLFIDEWDATVCPTGKQRKVSSHYYKKNIPTTEWDNTGYKNLGLLFTKYTICNKQLVSLAIPRILSYVKNNTDKQAIFYLLNLKREAHLPKKPL